MGIEIARVPKRENPALIDKTIEKIQDFLAANIGWLDHAFGRAERLVTLRDKSEWYYPGVYVGDGEYLNVLPGQGLGNRTFFIVSDPAVVDTSGRLVYLTSTVGLVCWYDLSTIYPDASRRNTEAVKWKLLKSLDRMMRPSGIWITISRTYDLAENIFKEYSLREVDSQYLMQPYGGVRIEMSLKYREECYD